MVEGNVFQVSQLSETVWKVIESDYMDERPFLYIIIGQDKVVLVDTGVGTSNYQEFLKAQSWLTETNLPYFVINTHGHFDHVGCNHLFSSSTTTGKAQGCLELCMSAANPQFSMNQTSESTSKGLPVASPYVVTRWLQDGELISLSSHHTSPEHTLLVMHIPGHSPDSLVVWYPKDRRLFIGDFVYTGSPVPLNLPSSSLLEYEKSVVRLQTWLSELPNSESVVLSCGHLSDSLPAVKTLGILHSIVTQIRQGATPWCEMDGSKIYAEGNISLCVGNREVSCFSIATEWMDECFDSSFL